MSNKRICVLDLALLFFFLTNHLFLTFCQSWLLNKQSVLSKAMNVMYSNQLSFYAQAFRLVTRLIKVIFQCRPEYKVPGLYVMDSVVRQSRHQFGAEKDVFMPRLCKNIISTFQHIYKCPPEDKVNGLKIKISKILL